MNKKWFKLTVEEKLKNIKKDYNHFINLGNSTFPAKTIDILKKARSKQMNIIVEEVVDDFMSELKLFTSLDVSNEVKLRGNNVRHREVAEIVRNLFNEIMIKRDYNRRLITVNLGPDETTKAYLYFYKSLSSDYTKTSQKAIHFQEDKKTVSDIGDVAETTLMDILHVKSKSDGRLEVPKKMLPWKSGTSVDFIIVAGKIELFVDSLVCDYVIRVDPFGRLRIPVSMMREAGFGKSYDNFKISKINDVLVITK